mmetsp:Transcript_26646/g.23612  ORF Transcript_26646/g.23612 Transcript_26646/m.23612 type:complete len:87 (-) Transcript_26646:810-1070(-)
MECIDGESLEEVLNNLPEGSKIPEGMIINWILQICNGLAHLHRFGLCHKNLKPSNIFLTSDGTIKLSSYCIGYDYIPHKYIRRTLI